MIQEMIDQNRVRLHRLAIAAVVAALVLAAYSGLTAGYWTHQALSGTNSFSQFVGPSFYITTLGLLLSGSVFPALLLVYVFALAWCLAHRSHSVPSILRHADVWIYAYIVIRLFLVAYWTWSLKIRQLPDGAPFYDILILWLSPAYILLEVAKLVSWTMAAVAWRRAVVLLEQLRQGTPAAAEWVERNRQLLLRLANACGVVGILILLHAGMYGYAHMSRHIERAAEVYEYVKTAAQIAAGFLFHTALLLGVYGFIRCVVDRKRTVPLLLLHGEKVIYLYIVVAMASKLVPLWRMLAPALDPSSRSRSFGSLWVFLIVPVSILITSLPLVVWAMFAPIVKRGAAMMEKQRAKED